MRKHTPVYATVPMIRYSWCLANGVDLEQARSTWVGRTCGNPRCVRPKHLLKYGDGYGPRQRLRRDQVIAILHLAAKYGAQLNVKALADYLGRPHSVVGSVVRRKAWRGISVPADYRLPKHYERVPRLLFRWRTPLTDEQRQDLQGKVDLCDTLPALERSLLNTRFGLDGNPPRSVAEIARQNKMLYSSADRMIRRALKIIDGVQQSPKHFLSFDARDDLQTRINASSLTERERAALSARYGLEGQSPQRLAHIGQLMGISRQRVDQLVKSARAKLKRAGGAQENDTTKINSTTIQS